MTAAAETHSFARAEHVLSVLSEITITSRQVNRISDDAGRELRAAQQERAARHEQRQLAVEVENIPELAVVETDGGRIATRESGYGSGTHHAAWKESKTALFMRMTSNTCEHDPAPEPPESLQNRAYVGKLVREVTGVGSEDVSCDESVDSVSQATAYEGPQRLMRTCLASNLRVKSNSTYWLSDNAETMIRLRAWIKAGRAEELFRQTTYVANDLAP